MKGWGGVGHEGVGGSCRGGVGWVKTQLMIAYFKCG